MIRVKLKLHLFDHFPSYYHIVDCFWQYIYEFPGESTRRSIASMHSSFKTGKNESLAKDSRNATDRDLELC